MSSTVGSGTAAEDSGHARELFAQSAQGVAECSDPLARLGNHLGWRFRYKGFVTQLGLRFGNLDRTSVV